MNFYNLDRLDIFCLRAFLTLGHSKAHLLAFNKGFKTSTSNSAEVSENIRTGFLLNETKTFSVIEPFNSASSNFRHSVTYTYKVNLSRRELSWKCGNYLCIQDEILVWNFEV